MGRPTKTLGYKEGGLNVLAIGSNLIEGREQIARTREAEQLEAAKFYDDEGLLDSQELRRQVLNVIRWADPAVSRVMLSLPGRNVPADEPPISRKPSLFYWDAAAGLHFEPQAYVDITAEMEIKLRALECHKSQYAWMDTFQIHNFNDHCRILSELRGLQAGCRYAEGFRAFRIHGFMPDFKLLP
jgi:hypothetical protein